MKARVLFVSNGHGEISIAQRIANELPEGIAADHLALVGDIPVQGGALCDVGPRRTMPSGGLIAMGNVRNIGRDLAGGLLAHTVSQLRFFKSVRAQYDAAVAVGDAFALWMTLRARARKTLYVGTAKSAYVAPYGRFERALLARADAVFVRDEATAQALRDRGIAANAANVIADLSGGTQAAPLTPFDPLLAVFPGSREAAYADAVRLCALVRDVSREFPHCGALLSVAPALDANRMRSALAQDGWRIEPSDDASMPFTAYDGAREIMRAWRGDIAAMLERAALVLGQAGTANEAAAARGVPVVAYEDDKRAAWYRRRQIALLGDALLVVRGDAAQAARAVVQLLRDGARREAMGRAGRERMGRPGGAAAVAAEIVRLCG